MSHKAQEKSGFALPAALFAVTILAVLTTAGFYNARQEMKVAQATESGTLAFYMAELGLNEVMANWDPTTFQGIPLWNTLTLSDTLADGIWEVQVTKGANRIFYLDATSTITRGGPMLEGASRRVGVLARVSTADLDPPAALTTRNNLSVKGNAEIHGENADPPAWGPACTSPAVNKPGVLIDDATDLNYSGQGKITGVPPVQVDPTIGTSTFTQFGDLSWAELTSMATKKYAGGAINQTQPYYFGDGTCNRGHNLNWGEPLDPTDACGSHFPIIHITGNANIQSGSRGQGIMLVDGDLDLRGDFVFSGIVIVQGNFETQGSGNRIYGAVMAGNADFDNQSVVGGSEIQYSACAIERTLLNIGSLTRARPIFQRSWVDLSSVISS